MRFKRSLLKSRWVLVSAALIAVAGASYFPLKYIVKPKVRVWRSARLNESARDYLRREDWSNALVMSRKNLQSAGDNSEAWRIASMAAKKLGRPEALYYQESLCRLVPSKENYLEFIRLAVSFHQDGLAIEAIKKASPLAGNEPEFHEAAAALYIRGGRPIDAKYHLVTLLGLRPTDKKATLDLAEIELNEDVERKNLALRARIRTLADDPEIRVRALSLLLRDSVRAKTNVESAELAARLRLIPDLALPERMLLAQATKLCTPERLTAEIAALQTSTAASPIETASVMRLMVSLERAADVSTWFKALGEETKSSEFVRLAVAEAIFSLQKWADLRALVQEGSWASLDYIRRAFLAYTYKIEGATAAFDEAWKSAVLDAGSNLRSTIDLYSRIETWKWDRERFDVLWRLFALMPENKEVRQALLVWERRQGNTANLNRLFGRIIDTDPNDRVAKNNFAYTSLLLEANVTRARMLAKEVLDAEPDNPYFKTTFALALYKEGKEAEALNIISSLRESALSTPERTALRSLFLAGNHQYNEASNTLEKVVSKNLLPEEKRLLATTNAEIARNQRAKDNVERLRAIQDTKENAAGYLALLPPTVRAEATVEMQIADSLYAAHNIKALATSLRDGHWKDHEYLRFALLAYCQRAEQLPAARDNWQHSLSVAARGVAPLQALCELASKWSWRSERIEALNLLHQFSPGDPARLTELLDYYREAKRTPDLVRVLRPKVETERSAPENVPYAYYALLSNVDTAQATVAAKSAFDTNPTDAERRLLYAFSLWKQQRNSEAREILNSTRAGITAVVPGSLIHALVEVDMGKLEDAERDLRSFDEKRALPEELELRKKAVAKIAEVKS